VPLDLEAEVSEQFKKCKFKLPYKKAILEIAVFFAVKIFMHTAYLLQFYFPRQYKKIAF